jgi:alpha/beta superfamily hydrolase
LRVEKVRLTNSRAITFRTDDLTLEGVLHEPIGADSFPAVAVCHPHPLYGGDMHNGVVVSVCNALTARGIAALRFNFRGVGRSEGSHGGGTAERDDARAAITYLQALGSAEARGIGLAGYSFGAAVALSAAVPVRALAAVSSPFAGLDISSTQADIPVLLVAGDRDEFADSARLEKMAESAGPRVRAVIVPGADHFWWDHLGVVADTVADFFSEKLS